MRVLEIHGDSADFGRTHAAEYAPLTKAYLAERLERAGDALWSGQNADADTILSLIEAPGYLENRDDENSLIQTITAGELKAREDQVEGRMKRKMLALRKLIDNGAKTVVISDGRVEHPIKGALAGKGTTIK